MRSVERDRHERYVRGCNSVQRRPSKWDVARVVDMSDMFWSAVAFNGNLSKWDVSRVDNMNMMFRAAKLFNCDLSKWDVSSVETMSDMVWDA